MSKFRVTLTYVKWMKATVWNLMLTHLNFLLNRLLLYGGGGGGGGIRVLWIEDFGQNWGWIMDF